VTESMKRRYRADLGTHAGDDDIMSLCKNILRWLLNTPYFGMDFRESSNDGLIMKKTVSISGSKCFRIFS
jgi:hypothetical protein